VVPPLKMRVEYGQWVTEGEIDSLRFEMEEKMSSLLRFRPSIEFVPPESLEKTAGKVRLFGKVYDKLHNLTSRIVE